MNNRQQATLAALFVQPVRLDIRWAEVVALLRALEATIDESRAGSRVGVHLNGATIILHRPHPRTVIGPETVRSLRRFLREARVPVATDALDRTDEQADPPTDRIPRTRP